MPAPEVGIATVAMKWWGVIFAPIFVWVWAKLNNTYTKEETDKQIALHLGPIKKSLDQNTTALEKFTDRLTDLRIMEARHHPDE